MSNSMRLIRTALLAAALAAAPLGCSKSVSVAVPPSLVGAITVAPQRVIAGDMVAVSCMLRDDTGMQHAPTADAVPVLTFAPAESVRLDAKKHPIAVRAGMVTVRCAFPTLALVDDKGASFAIAPGPAAVIETRLSANQVVAGATVKATCASFDAWGNLVTDAKPAVVAMPAQAGNTISGLDATMTHAGLYDVACSLGGASSHSVQVEVQPSLPAKVVMSKLPDLPLYTVGALVEFPVLVTDTYGNPIGSAPLSFASAPSASASFGLGRFRYLSPGSYRITGQVAAPTQAGGPISATTVIEVGGVGPSITCDAPLNGAMLNASPGTTVSVGGTITAPNGVASVMVNGQLAQLTNNQFSSSVTTRFGINSVQVDATGNDGASNRRTCWFLAADQWAPENAPENDTVSLSLTQAAFDDGDRSGALNDVADILYTVLNSTGLRDALNNALLASNPLKPQGCDSQTCTPFGCICWYSSGVDYLGSSLPGPNTVSLTLVDGGIAASAYLPNVGVDLHVHGKVGPIPYDTSGRVTLSYVSVALTLDATLSGGQPQVSVRPGSVSAGVGSVSTNFGGLDGWIINNVVVPLAQGTIRNAVQNQLQNQVTSRVNSIIGQLLAGLNISAFGSTFNVPRLDGSGPIPLSFGVGASTLTVAPSRALFGLATGITAPAAQALPSLGVPVPPGNVLLDPSLGAPDTAAAAVHVAVFNQALHALWRAGMFNVTLGGANLGGAVSPGASVTVNTLLPPVANMTGTGSGGNPTAVELSIGSMQLDVSYPGLFGGTDAAGQPLPTLKVDLGARATTTVTLAGNSLQFGGLTITELAFSTDGISISGATQMALDGLLRGLVTTFVNQALNQALPALPIPTFPLPATLAQYGLPAGAQLGLVGPSVTIEPLHFVLRGGFGIW